MQQVLEGANIKLSSVATDITGASGREMLKALAEGDDDPQDLAALAKGRLCNKGLELVQALQGMMGPHQRMLLQSQLRHLDFLAQEIAQLDQEVEQRMGPFEAAIQAAGRLIYVPAGLVRHRVPFLGRRGHCI